MRKNNEKNEEGPTQTSRESSVKATLRTKKDKETKAELYGVVEMNKVWGGGRGGSTGSQLHSPKVVAVNNDRFQSDFRSLFSVRGIFLFIFLCAFLCCFCCCQSYDPDL